MRSHHAILVTYGEPPHPSFSQQLAYSWRILLGLTRTVAPIPRPVLPLIALARGWGRRQLWNEHGYRSPLEAVTLRQADALCRALEAARPDRRWVVHTAYEFRRPLLAELLAAIPRHEPVSVVPMYATDSAFTHELSRTVVAAESGREAPVRVLPPLECDVLAEVSAAHVLRHVGGDEGGPATALVLAAHGTLLEPTRPIDTGRCATERLFGGLRARLGSRFGLVLNGWLNHTRGGRWTEPPIGETLRLVRGAGFERVVYFPFGFLADNAETQLEGRMALAAHPDLHARLLPCLNDSPALADALAAQILDDIIPTRDARAASHRLPGMRLHHTRS